MRGLRKAAGLTQAEVAAAIGVERSTLTGNETGAAMPGREAMANLARFYRVSIDYIESGTEPIGNDVTGESVQDISEASLLRFWRLLDKGQKDNLLARIADLIGAKIARPTATAPGHTSPVKAR